MFNPDRKKVYSIVIAWTFTGFLMSVHDHFALHSVISKGSSPEYNFLSQAIINITVGFVTGCLAGSFMVYVVSKKFSQSPYWISISLVGVFFFLMSGCLITIVSFVESVIALSGSDSFRVYFFDSLHIKNILVWFPVLIVTQVALQVHDKFGPRNLWRMIVGRYHTPKEETRIFMVLDIRSSTAIAEKLGNQQYHLFLRDFYSDITPAIVDNGGEIYQYVGDEIVISWQKTRNHFTPDCLQCFFDISSHISGFSEKYLGQYGLIPEFKAGIHFGEVTVGEIGVIKRDITFSGDVLNTTSRIQSLCNEFGVRILCSEALLNQLPSDIPFVYRPLGEIHLRGKEKMISLCVVEEG